MKRAARNELARMLSAGHAEMTDLFVALGRERFPVATVEDASQIWSRFVDQIARTTGDSGFSHLGNGFPLVDSRNHPVARISYNGRIWPHEDHPNRKEPAMTKSKNTKKTPAAKKAVAKTETAATPAAEPEVVTTASKKAAAKTAKEKKGRERKTPIEEGDLVVFAFRLLPEERDAIHAAAGPAKASKFARAFLVAAAKGDEALVKEMLKGVNQQK